MRLNEEAYSRLMQLKEDSPDGRVHPEAVVADAKSKQSPLHQFFTWDNSKAAHEYRLWEARQLLRVAVQIIEPQPGEVRRISVFTRLHDERGYRPMVDVLSEQDTRERLLQTALLELERLRAKYAELTELAEVFRALEKIAA